MTNHTEPVLVLSDGHGRYIPELWCSDITEPDCSKYGIRWEDVQTCQAGPDEEWYWEAWDSILNACHLKDERGITWTLHQDGDLWEVPDTFHDPAFFGDC
jgi:hypothetical protein